MMTKKNLYTGEPIEKSDRAYAVLKNLPQAAQDAIGFRHVVDNKGREKYIADPWALWTMQNLGVSRYYSTVGKMFDGDFDERQMERFLNFTTGVKVAAVDVNKQKAWNEYNQKRLALEQFRKEQKYTTIPN
jgi:hypothetical protein